MFESYHTGDHVVVHYNKPGEKDVKMYTGEVIDQRASKTGQKLLTLRSFDSTGNEQYRSFREDRVAQISLQLSI